MKEVILVLSAGQPWHIAETGLKGFNLQFIYNDDIDPSEGSVINEINHPDPEGERGSLTTLPGFYEVTLKRKSIKASNGKKVSTLVPSDFDFVKDFKPDFTKPKKS